MSVVNMQLAEIGFELLSLWPKFSNHKVLFSVGNHFLYKNYYISVHREHSLPGSEKKL